MKEIQNIFSNTKTEKTVCPNPNNPIIVDTREKQSLIAANLIEQKAKISFETLEIGDYLINDTIIERKTFQDFVLSMINKRLQEQLINLKKYKKQILLIEGFDYNYNKTKVHENAIRGMLLSVALDFQTPIIFTKDCEDTSKFLILTAKKDEKPKKEISTRPSKNIINIEEQKMFILEGFPGVGPTTAYYLLKEFGNLQSIFNAKKEDLKKVNTWDEKKIDKFRELLDTS